MAASQIDPKASDDMCRKVLLAFTCFTGQFVVMGLYYSYGQLFAALKHETGESGGKLAAIGSTRDFVLNAMMAVGGLCVKDFGYVKLATLGSALLIVGLILDSFVPSTSWLFLSLGIISGTGCGLLCVPSCMVLYSQLTGKMLPLAVGFAAAGGGAGTIAFNSALAPITAAWGWRHARQVLAAALLGLLTVNTLLLHWSIPRKARSQDKRVQKSSTISSNASDESTDAGVDLQTSDNSSITTTSTSPEKVEKVQPLELVKEFFRPFGDASFAFLSAGLLLYLGGFTVPYTHLVYYAELHGYDKGAMLISIMGGGSLVGRILCGIGATVVNPRHLFLLVIVIQASSLAWLPACESEFGLVTFSVLFGGSSGARVALVSLVVWELYGAEKVPQLFGLTGLTIGVGTFIGPTLVGGIFDFTGSYEVAFLTSACLVFASIPFMLLSYRYAAPHGQQELKKIEIQDSKV